MNAAWIVTDGSINPQDTVLRSGLGRRSGEETPPPAVSEASRRKPSLQSVKFLAARWTTRSHVSLPRLENAKNISHFLQRSAPHPVTGYATGNEYHTDSNLFFPGRNLHFDRKWLKTPSGRNGFFEVVRFY